MLSFKQYLNERLVDPSALADRVARRFGKKTRYGKWLTTEKGKHIPLSGYKPKEADSVFNRFDRVLTKATGSTSFPKGEEARNVGRKKRDGMYQDAEHPIKSLIPTQPFVSTGDKEKLNSKIKDTHPNNVVTATHKGRTYILDGHHAVMAASLRGDTHIKTKYVNLDSY